MSIYFLIVPSITCVVCDRLSDAVTKYLGRYPGVLFDNFCHGVIAFIIWLAISENIKLETVLQSLLAMAFAIFIDVDHFIQAKSLSLDKALNLEKPAAILHSVLVEIYANLFILVCAKLSFANKITIFNKKSLPQRVLEKLHVLFFLAWTTHLSRDAIKKGFLNSYVFQFQTAPISYSSYLLLTTLISAICKFL